jgi:regulator of protease activity HflC (stomatin/prohibitin superfamily)
LEEVKKMLTPMFVMALLCAAVVLFVASVKRIPEGQAYTLRRVGGHVRTLGAGTHLVLPVVERVAHKIRLLGNVVEVSEIAAPGQNATLCGQVYYQVLDAARADAIIDEVAPRMRERLPELIASAPSQDVSARNLHLKTELNRSLRERGLLVTRVQLV